MEFMGVPVPAIDEQERYKRYREALKQIRIIILTVDGVLTDGHINYTESGDEIRTFFARDGFAIKEALAQGLRVVVISTRPLKATMRRMIELGVTDVYLGIRNKLETYEEIKMLYGVTDEECLYIGDDYDDLPILKKVGFSATPLNGIEALRYNVGYVSAFEGGKGCVRDVIELTLVEQGKWQYGELYR
ncbi:MAG: 3-deoxy-D-manno-octulosonate 8-phosphate phosphatase [Chloroherpetonaceae bacterium]|nr:3-deoxy-D-manno-octulosonate 8-phosphate phosphatase [Chloroherpetonaceae bacterium]